MILSAQVVIDKPSSSGGTDTSYVNQKLAEAKTYTDNTLTGLQSSIGVLAASKTVNLDSTMTASQIQDSINAYPKNLNGKALTFQFADGTYTLDNTIYFREFHNGSLFIQGNVSESSVKYTSHSVILNFSSAFGIEVRSVSSIVRIYNIRINAISGVWGACLAITTNIGYIDIQRCYVYNNVTGAHNYLINNSNFVKIQDSYARGSDFGVYCMAQSTLYVKNNSSAATIPIYGMNALEGSTIIKMDVVGFTGSNSNEQISLGGLIR
jgi:hypothetical protein